MCAMFESLTSFASYFDLVFVPVCRISCRESSGYTFGITVQMYEVFWRIFGSEYSRARPSTGRSDQVIDSVCFAVDALLTVAVAAPATWA